jgi:hypothetical protein
VISNCVECRLNKTIVNRLAKVYADTLDELRVLSLELELQFDAHLVHLMSRHKRVMA